MLLSSLGHAGLEVEYDGARVQMDPWLTPHGAFQASWFQWPDNSHLIDRLQPPNAVAISHEHLDHVDAWWLRMLPKGTPVYFPRYPLSVLRAKVLASGQTNLVELDPWEEREVAPGIRLFFVPERSPMNHDSGIVVRTPDCVLVNANDARLCPLQLHEIRAKVDRIHVLALQGAGASWYPMVYNYSDEQKKKLSHRKRMAKLAYVVQATKAVQPDLVLPFAGPPAFLDPELFYLNKEMEEGIFPDHEQVANWVKSKGFQNVEILYPGDQIDVLSHSVKRDPRWEDFNYSERERHLTAYASHRCAEIAAVKAQYPIPDDDLWPSFRDYFQQLLTYSPYFNRRIGMSVGFEITGPGGFAGSVDFREESMAVYPHLDNVSYRYTFESRWLPSILRGQVPWEDFFLSCRMRVWREPDVYNDHLLGLLKFAQRRPLAAVEEWEMSRRDGQTITVRSGGRTFEVSRFCPHAGQDLLEVGEILPGDILRCNGHHLEFDLLSGVCVNGSIDPLSSRLAADCDQENVGERSGELCSAANVELS
jgi:UDP-MurNAc hydroxylase